MTHSGYKPKSDFERRCWPYLGRAKVVKSPYPKDIGREGTIILRQNDCRPNKKSVIRIAFDNFWDRPDGMDAIEADDSGYFFDGEYEILE